MRKGRRIEVVTLSTPYAKIRQRRGFVKVPWAWVNKLKTKRVVTYRVALHLLYASWKAGGGQPIALSNLAVNDLSISRQSKWNAILELERAGMVKVDRRPRKAPLITVVEA